MSPFIQDFTTRQYMVSSDFEYFHYKDEKKMEVEYHNHEFYEIFFFMSGKVVYLIEGKSYKLRPGDILLINNREVHKPVIEAGEPYERVVIWVNPDFAGRYSNHETKLNACFEASTQNRYNLLRPSGEVQSSIRNALARFEKACSISGFGSSILKETHLAELLVYLNRAFLVEDLETVEIDIDFNEKVDNVIRYINDNLNSDLSLDNLAAKFYMSKYHLLREFKKYAGYTIHQYIQHKRLIMAKSLLKENMQVIEVCERCGFDDYSNFIRSFKKAFGIPPKKFSKRNAEA